MTTHYSIGRMAEAAAADYLIAQGYTLLGQNWRTRYCEIDIIALKDNAVHFVEVKYRKSGDQGTGLDYITPKKLTQMRFAAELWLKDKNWTKAARLSALEVSGQAFTVTYFVPDCSELS